jgi:hypothetical protein
MTVMPATLIAAYILPLLLVAFLLARSPLRQWQKALLLAALPVFYVLHYHAIAELRGWPTEQALPERFRLLGQQVTQPDKRSGDPGNIRLWVQVDSGRPSRLYQLPYSRKLHQQLAAAEMRAAKGRQQVGRRNGNNGPRSEASAPEQRIEFSDLPRTSPPAKPTGDSTTAD